MNLPSCVQEKPPRLGGELILIIKSLPSTSKSLNTREESITSPSLILNISSDGIGQSLTGFIHSETVTVSLESPVSSNA